LAKFIRKQNSSLLKEAFILCAVGLDVDIIRVGRAGVSNQMSLLDGTLVT